MNLLFVMGFFLPVPPLRGGAAEKSSLALAEWLSQRGHTVTVYSRQWPSLPDEEVLNHVRHRRFRGHNHTSSLPLNLLRDAGWNFRLRPHWSGFDAIISHSVLLPAIFPRLSHPPAILQWVARMPKPGQAHLWRRATRILAASNAVAKATQNSAPSLAAKLRVVPYPIDAAILREAAGERSPSNPLVEIGYAGRIHPEKGLDLLLEAAALLARQTDLPRWRLTLTGPSAIPDGGGGPEYLAHLQNLARNIPELVRFCPPIHQPRELARRYAETDLFVYPSQAERGEALGVAPLEAMAAGCVPIVSHLDCFRDFVENGKNGLSFDANSDDAARELCRQLTFALKNPDWREKVRLAARHSAAVYDLPAVGGALEAVLAETIRRPVR